METKRGDRKSFAPVSSCTMKLPIRKPRTGGCLWEWVRLCLFCRDQHVRRGQPGPQEDDGWLRRRRWRWKKRRTLLSSWPKLNPKGGQQGSSLDLCEASPSGDQRCGSAVMLLWPRIWVYDSCVLRSRGAWGAGGLELTSWGPSSPALVAERNWGRRETGRDGGDTASSYFPSQAAGT